MNHATRAIITVAALALPLGAYAQNNTLATPSTTSPAAVKPAPSKPAYASGSADSNPSQPDNTNHGSTPLANPPGSHNTLATPSVVSPAAGQ